MAIGKYIEKDFRPFFYSLSIVLGIYLAATEFTIAGNERNFTVFSIASIIIYIFEVTTYYLTTEEEAGFLKKITVTQKFKKRFFENSILPVSNIVLLIVLGISGMEKIFIFTLIIALMILYFGFRNIRKTFFQNTSIEIGDTIADLHRLLFIFIISILVGSFALRNNPMVLAGMVIFFFSVALISISALIFRTRIRIAVGVSFVIAYILTTFMLIILTLFPKDILLTAFSIYFTIIYYVLMVCGQIIIEEKKFKVKSLANYLYVIILATIILAFSR